jgi:hypothetical protein
MYYKILILGISGMLGHVLYAEFLKNSMEKMLPYIHTQTRRNK